ncbi:MAG: GH116 family glycosyl hydrolase [Janthinobacterium lividum]
MTRKCKCSGPCGPQAEGVTRREFITLVGVGTAGVLLTQPGSAWGETSPVTDAQIKQWLRDVRQPGTPRVYRSDTHTDVGLPLGGIGTGNIEIGPEGQLKNWQLFNTLTDGFVPLVFAVKVGDTVRMLQTTGDLGMTRIARIEMTGQYPVADLNYIDPALPVTLSLTTFTPFAPLDTAFSSLPLICFVFRVHNPTAQAQTVSLAALMQNPIGYEAQGQAALTYATVEHPSVGANVNTILHEGAAPILSMSAVPSPLPVLGRRIRLYTNASPNILTSFKGERPEQLLIEDVQHLADAAQPLAHPEEAVIWLEEASVDFPEKTLLKVQDAVTAGATLIFSGKTLPLVQAYQETPKPNGKQVTTTDTVFEDFDGGYDRWTVEGTAFGQKPAAGTEANQQPVGGLRGTGLVNSFLGGDASTGRLTSRPFTVSHRFIRFLVGGGDHQGTQIRLVIDGKVVRATSGQNSEMLMPEQWVVSEFHGQTAHIEIVDQETGAWGHILVDQIVFSDVALQPSMFVILQALLGTLPAKLPDSLERAAGQGKVIVLSSALLSSADANLRGARQQAYSRIAALAGAEYAVPRSVTATAPGYGTIALGTLGGSPTAAASFDDFSHALGEFAVQGKFGSPAGGAPNPPTPSGRTVNGALASSVQVPPGATVEVPFFLAWHYPNNYNAGGTPIGNQYTQAWPDAGAVVRHAVAAFPEMREKTEAFRRTFNDSTLPVWMLDCISSQISTIRHIGVVFRIASGDIYGWEGANGCCDPTCTHVWGYEQTLSRLFPDLERNMRRIDLFHQQGPDGGINNRTDVPSPPHPSGQGPFTDGHASTILKAYREVLNSTDPSLLHQYWPPVKRAVDYLIAHDAASSGGHPNGTLSDDQANTYDNTIHGVNSFIGTYYLAALRAGEEMAIRVGDTATALRFRVVFEAGQVNLDAQCWNGEYYQQNLPDYLTREGEYGPGCLADQLLGQWWAHQLDLGYVLPKQHVQSALRALYKYNWKTDFTNFQHNWRHFAGGTDKGLLICTWPKGGRPASTIPYVDEVWTGVEYQVAAHMLYEGLVEEGYAVVKGARERYDGIPRAPMPRNPWSEIECGGHYARAMSSWSLLLALSGFHYESRSQTLHFQPLENPAEFKSFFTGPEGWGSLSQTQHGAMRRTQVQVVAGQVAVTRLRLAAAPGASKAKVTLGHAAVSSQLTHGPDGVLLIFSHPIEVRPGSLLTVELS